MDPFRPRLIVSWKLFQFVFVHFIYNSALFLAPCCCAFLLHVVASLIFIFLVSRHLVLLSTVSKSVYSFFGQEVYTGCYSGKFNLDVNRFYPFFFVRVQITLAYKRMWKAGAFYTEILKNLWTKIGLKVLFRIPNIWANFASFCRISCALMCRLLVTPFESCDVPCMSSSRLLERKTCRRIRNETR